MLQSKSPKCRVRLQRGRQQQPAHKNERRGALDAAAAMRSNAPQNQQPFPAARVKHTAHASTGTTSAAHSTARAPLQQHLHFLHATPRHTLHHHLSPAPRHVGHVHIGRRSDQSLARERHAGEHAAQSPARGIFRDNRGEGRQLWLPTVMRKKPLVVLEKLELAGYDDLTAKLRGRLQYAVGNEGKKHGSAVEAIRKCENVGRHVGGGGCDLRHYTCNSLLGHEVWYLASLLMVSEI